MLHFFHPSIDGHLGRFHILAFMNNASMNICIQIFVWTYLFNSLGYIPRSRIAGVYVNSKFNLLKNYQTVRQASVQFHIPTSNVQGFQFLYILTSAYYFPFSKKL